MKTRKEAFALSKTAEGRVVWSGPYDDDDSVWERQYVRKLPLDRAWEVATPSNVLNRSA